MQFQGFSKTERNKEGSGCVSYGGTIASDTRDPRFKSSIKICIGKTKKKEKEAGNGQFFQKSST